MDGDLSDFLRAGIIWMQKNAASGTGAVGAVRAGMAMPDAPVPVSGTANADAVTSHKRVVGKVRKQIVR
jgi:hypothetical protein